MKWLLALALWFWAAGPGSTATTVEQTFTCPIDGESWKQQMETANRPAGLRLDLKKLGDVVEPPTLPQCPKCRYVMVSEGMAEPVMKKLKAFVLGGDYQMFADKSPSWACLAYLQEFLGAAPIYTGFSYLRASWQVEEKPALVDRYLSRAYDRFSKAAASMPPKDNDRLNVLLLCGELERRLGKFEEGEKRFLELLSAEEFKNEPRRLPIARRQLKLIALKDRGPQTLSGDEKKPLRVPAGAAPPVPKVIDQPDKPRSSGPLDINKPFSLETGTGNPFPPR